VRNETHARSDEWMSDAMRLGQTGRDGYDILPRGRWAALTVVGSRFSGGHGRSFKYTPIRRIYFYKIVRIGVLSNLMPNKQLTPTSFAILGLLAIQPFTTYELAQQMDRTVSWFWPRAASMVYEEPKKLAAAGLATAQASFTGKRRSTVYKITEAGREALREWLDAPAAGMRMEFAAMLKVAFADAGDASQLRSAVTEIRADAEARLAEILYRSSQYATRGGPFPDRLPIVAITGKLLMGQYEAVVRWAQWAEDAIGEWTGVTQAGGATVPPYAFTSGWPAQDA
jgi:PadR family transcriptional regulator AphA